MARPRLLSTPRQHNGDQEVRSYPASEIAAHNQQKNPESTHQQVATSRRKANNVSRLCRRAQLPPHNKPSSKNDGTRSWARQGSAFENDHAAAWAQPGENDRLRSRDDQLRRAPGPGIESQATLRLRKKAAVGPFPVSTTAFLYLKTLVDCDEWSRCETDEDLACYCTSRLVTLANAN